MMTSNCGDVTMKGTAVEIVRKYEGLAFGAEKSGDHMQATIYRQHAEHYKRIKK